MKKLLLALMIFSCVFLMSSCDQSIGTKPDGKALQEMFEEGNYSDVAGKNFSDVLIDQTEVSTGRV